MDNKIDKIDLAAGKGAGNLHAHRPLDGKGHLHAQGPVEGKGALHGLRPKDEAHGKPPASGANDNFAASAELQDEGAETDADVPFFARFLEQQTESNPEHKVTMAYPSDSDRDLDNAPKGGPQVTMAYPSDSDRDIDHAPKLKAPKPL